MKGILHLDVETRSACDLKKAGAHAYARHATTDLLCVAWAFDDEPVQLWRPGEPVPIHTRSDTPVWAHNAPFERLIINHVGVRWGWKAIASEQMTCTLALAHSMSLPGSLERAAAALGLAMRKDDAGHRIMLQLSQPRTTEPLTWYTPESHPEKFARLYAYCAQDVEVERALGQRLLALSGNERAVWLLDQEINDRGIGVDVPAVIAALALVESEKARLDVAMREATGGAVGTCSAVGQLTDWLKAQGVVTDGVAKADVAALLEHGVPVYDTKRAAKLVASSLEDLLCS